MVTQAGGKMRSKLMAAALALGTSVPAMAVDNVADINLRGMLIEPPPCTINSGGQVDVDFGDRLGVESIDGARYRVPLNYSIDCQPATGGSGWSMTMMIDGGVAGFDVYALQTDVADLGIRVYQGSGNTLMEPGVDYKVTAASPPVLEAVPVKRSGSTLPEGAFEAVATLRVVYQ